MPFIKISGLKAGDLTIWYERTGQELDQRARLLYITGTGADLRKQPNPLGSPLAGQFDLLTYDQRGLGRTDKPDGPYTMAQYAEDAANLLDAVGWQSCNVMGVSFGGMVAQELAIRFPAKVNKLVLCCCSADIVMPGEFDGMALAAYAAQRHPDIAILLTSGFPGDALSRVENREDFPVLAKPYRNAELARTVREVLLRKLRGGPGA
jgi:pimeloyl-ACP methyl ester carboxylesterase